MDDWVRVRLGPGRRSGRGDAARRAAPVCSPRWCGPTGCSSYPPEWRATTPASEVGSSCCAGWTRSPRPSSRSGRTTSCSTWPPPRCAPSTRGITLASSNVGSLGGLVALRDGLCHVAGSHLLDPATGEYTLPYVDRLLGRADVAVDPARAPRPGPDRRARQPAGAAGDRRPGPPGRAVRQPAARRRHPGAARPRAGPAGHRPGRIDGLRPRGAHPPGGGGGRGRRPGRRRPRHPRGRPGVRPGLRARGPGTVRPRAADRSTYPTAARHCGHCSSATTSAPRSRRWAATPARRPAVGSASAGRRAPPSPRCGRSRRSRCRPDGWPRRTGTARAPACAGRSGGPTSGPAGSRPGRCGRR